MSAFYLSPIVGRGTLDEPYRPAGAEDGSGWEAVYLTRPGRPGDGYALLSVPSRVDEAGKEYLGDHPRETVAALTKSAVGNRLSVELEDSRIDRLIAELLMVHGDSRTRWPRLRPSRVRRRYEIWLGGLLWSAPVVAGGVTLTESFNQPDSTALGPDQVWVEVSGDLQTVDQKARSVNALSNDVAALANDNLLATDDNRAKATVVDWTNPETNRPIFRILCRGLNTAITGYVIRCEGSSFTRLQRTEAGSNADIGDAFEAIVAGDTPAVQADGTTITGYINGTLKRTATDAVLTTGKSAGINIFHSDGQNVANCQVTPFEAADVVAGVAARSQAVLIA